MKRLRSFAAWYIGIGLMVGGLAWLNDPMSGPNELVMIPVIAWFWPLWILILIAT